MCPHLWEQTLVLATKNTASKNIHKKGFKKHTLIVSPQGTAPCTDRLIFNVVVQVFLHPLPPALRKTVTPAQMKTVTPALRKTVTPALRETVTPALRKTVTPALRETVTPALRETVTPALRKTVTPAQPPSREKLKEMKRLVGISVKNALQ